MLFHWNYYFYSQICCLQWFYIRNLIQFNDISNKVKKYVSVLIIYIHRNVDWWNSIMDYVSLIGDQKVVKKFYLIIKQGLNIWKKELNKI